MMESAYEFDLYLPLFRDDGSPMESSQLEGIKKTLVERFGGVTDFRHENEGRWKVGKSEFRDAILILRTLAAADRGAEARPFFSALKERLKKELQQEEILIVERQVRLV